MPETSWRSVPVGRHLPQTPRVVYTGVDLLMFYNSETKEKERSLPCKLYCSKCNSPVADEGRNMFLAFGLSFHFSSNDNIPQEFRHTCHLFYGERLVDLADDKPKWIGHKGCSPLWHP
mmetsp:Transcript_49781/g.101643  ORF Transcript_49781/g.101643 Transcript_49781/m.101643 type:complete len:118 (-) Transcript_49781:108-461(-)